MLWALNKCWVDGPRNSSMYLSKLFSLYVLKSSYKPRCTLTIKKWLSSLYQTHTGVGSCTSPKLKDKIITSSSMLHSSNLNRELFFHVGCTCNAVFFFVSSLKCLWGSAVMSSFAWPLPLIWWRNYPCLDKNPIPYFRWLRQPGDFQEEF